MESPSAPMARTGHTGGPSNERAVFCIASVESRAHVGDKIASAKVLTTATTRDAQDGRKMPHNQAGSVWRDLPTSTIDASSIIEAMEKCFHQSSRRSRYRLKMFPSVIEVFTISIDESENTCLHRQEIPRASLKRENIDIGKTLLS